MRNWREKRIECCCIEEGGMQPNLLVGHVTSGGRLSCGPGCPSRPATIDALDATLIDSPLCSITTLLQPISYRPARSWTFIPKPTLQTPPANQHNHLLIHRKHNPSRQHKSRQPRRRPPPKRRHTSFQIHLISAMEAILVHLFRLKRLHPRFHHI